MLADNEKLEGYPEKARLPVEHDLGGMRGPIMQRHPGACECENSTRPNTTRSHSREFLVPLKDNRVLYSKIFVDCVDTNRFCNAWDISVTYHLFVWTNLLSCMCLNCEYGTLWTVELAEIFWYVDECRECVNV